MLGICVPYLVTHDDHRRLFEHSIACIRRHTQGPYRLYGAIAQHCLPDTAERVRALGVELPDIPPSPQAGTLEHGYLLDALVDHAVIDGCTHVVTFDMDSWPVVDGWDEQSAQEVSEDVPVVAALRTELHANFPFPGFTFMHAGFWRVGASSFMTRLRASFPEEVVRRVSLPNEPGAGILCQLLQEGKVWRPLARSNGWNAHKVMAGLYGDRMFHLGGGSRRAFFGSDGPEFSLNGSVLRDDFALAVNAARQSFLLDAAVQRQDDLLTELRGESAVDRENPERLKAELKVARSRAHRAEQRVARLQSGLDACHASLSWRITAPLRWVGSAFGHFRWPGRKGAQGETGPR